MQRHVYQQRLLCLGRPNAQTLAIASTDNFHKLPEDLVRAKLNGRAWTSRKKKTHQHAIPWSISRWASPASRVDLSSILNA